MTARCWICIGLVSGLLTTVLGCATTSQVQYFAAVDPATNNINYYKMTVEGSSGLLARYKLRAGYFNAVTLDALTGSFSDPPEVSGDEEALQTFKDIDKVFRDTLKKDADAAMALGPSPENLIRIARARYLASLDDLSINSIGKTESLNPYVFQKLVFWAEAEPVNLQQFQGQFENIIKNSMAVVKGMRARAEQRRKEKEQEEQQENSLVHTALKLGESSNPELKPIFDIVRKRFPFGGGNPEEIPRNEDSRPPGNNGPPGDDGGGGQGTEADRDGSGSEESTQPEGGA
jgi:hypothetical protein